MENIKKHADKYIFYVCLAAAIIVGVVSFLLPPTGIIDPQF
jgi:preprotein translocase subunit Sec61beta